MTVKFSDKYRPRSFRDVRGQATAVRILSGLVRRQAGYPLLVHGAYGSGKTTLVRIFARALNCEQIEADGSPCDACPSCQTSGHLAEYDVPARGGDKEAVQSWIDANARVPSRGRWRVLFLDEAHALKDAATDSLLKSLELLDSRIVFAFATTEPWRLRETLRSRLFQVEVSPLSLAEAVSYLEDIAAKEALIYDREALRLLAIAKRGHPRDLVTVLEQAAHLDDRISVELVKSILGVNQIDHLVEYFSALAAGDAARQIEKLNSWPATVELKIEWIKALLATIFYQEILGQDVVLDSLTSSIADNGKIVGRFCQRFGVAHPQELADYWRQTMSFWEDDDRNADEATLKLKLYLFQDFVNRSYEPPVIQREASRILGIAGTTSNPTHSVPTVWPRASHDARGHNFIAVDDVYEIVNRASFFVQHYGKLFNASFVIYPSHKARSSDQDAVEAVKYFVAGLGDLCEELRTDAYATITLYDRDESGVLARVAAHIPQIAVDGAYRSKLAEWINEREQDGGSTITHRAFTGSTEASAVKFHWDCILDLCAGLSTFEDQSARDLLDNLNVSKQRRRDPGAITGPILTFSDRLAAVEIQRACGHNMAPLSAIDAGAWSFVRNGWERKEFKDRSEEIARRAALITEATELHRAYPDHLEEELRKLATSWRGKPEGRKRRWRGWWLS